MRENSRGKPLNFAFIEYVHACSAPYALQLYEGLKLYRKTLNIQYKADTSNTSGSQRHHDYQQRLSVNVATAQLISWTQL